jgi:hypothetical protein
VWERLNSFFFFGVIKGFNTVKFELLISTFLKKI